jgi:hypothetical protein
MKSCPKGHPINTRNSYVRASDNRRVCRVCSRVQQREKYQREYQASAAYQRRVVSR